MMEVKAERDSRGELKAETYIDLENGKTMRITTYKGMRGTLDTRAVCGISARGSFTVAYGGKLGDLSVMVASSNKRGTAKAIEAQHAAALARLDELKAKALAHYAPKAINPAGIDAPINGSSVGMLF